MDDLWKIETNIRRLEWLRAAEAVEASFKKFIEAFKFDPNQPRIPAGQEGGGQWTNDTPFESVSETNIIDIAMRRRQFDIDCEHQFDRDTFHCTMVGLPSCHRQAAQRYAACLAGTQIPPLNY